MAESFFGTETPASPDLTDGTAITIGTRFTPAVNGNATYGRWRFPTNIPHATIPVKMGIYRNSDQVLLGSTDFPLGATLGAWNQVEFAVAGTPTPIPLVAGVDYTVVAWSPGRYVATNSYAWPKTTTNMTTDSTIAGRYTSPSASISFPTGQFLATNYFPDLVFEPAVTTITKDTSFTWRVLNAVNKDTSFTWNVYNALTKDTSFSWRVLNAITKDAPYSWNVYNALTKDTPFTWRVLNALTKDVSFTWNVLNALTKDTSFTWNVYNAIQKDVSFTWDVLAGTHVNKDVSFTWNVYNAATKDTLFTWRVFNVVQKNQTFTWNVLGVSSITVSVWNGSQEVSVGSVSVWSGVTELPASITSVV